MKKLILLLICLLPTCVFADIDFGSGGTYDWSSTYWGKVNINAQGVGGTTNPTDEDELAKLARVTPSSTESFTNLDGWTLNNTGAGTCTIDPAGQLLCDTNGVGANDASMVDADFGMSDATWSIQLRAKFDVLHTATETNQDYGHGIIYNDGTNANSIFWRSDGTNIDVYTNLAGTKTKFDSSIPVGAVWRSVSFGNSGSGVYCDIDGTMIMTNGTFDVSAASAGSLTYDTNGFHAPQADIWWHNDQLDLYAIDTSYVTTAGSLEGNVDSAVYDAGSGMAWTTVDWDATTANSTTVTVEVRTADTKGGLATAAYFSATDNVAWASADQKQFIQPRIYLEDASSGLYTPVLNTFIIKDAATSTGASGGFKGLGAAGMGGRHR